MDRATRIRGGLMDHFSLKMCAALVVLGLSGPVSAALNVPIIGGKTGTIETLNRVVDGRAHALVRWTDQLGNVRRTAVALRPVAAQGGALVTRVLGGRLMATATVGLLLAEAVRGSLTSMWPDVQVRPDGVAVRPSTLPDWQTCERDLIKAPDASGVKRSAYGYLPCYMWASAPARLVLRLPATDPWRPDPAWLNEYDLGSERTREEFFVPAAQPGIAERGFREIIRPQPEKQLEMPQTEASLSPSELTTALMTPGVIGPLAQHDQLPAELWEPLRLSELETDPGSTEPGEGGSELPPDVGMGDVDRQVLDVRTWFTPDTWGWLPRTCSLPGAVVPLPQFPEWKIDFSQHEGAFCPLIRTYVVPASDLTAIVVFLTIVLRVRTGGA